MEHNRIKVLKERVESYKVCVSKYETKQKRGLSMNRVNRSADS